MNFIQKFFYGRNGTDQLNIVLLVVSILSTIANNFIGSGVLNTISYIFLLACMFRMLSRNIAARQRENARFLQILGPLGQRFFPNLGQQGHYHAPPRQKPAKDRANFRYFRCPNCKQGLRAPRGKGRVKITCSKCGVQFYKKV